MSRIGYARVSSRSQSHEEQIRLLKEAGCEVVRAEKESGKSLDGRDELATVLAFLRPGDSLVVTRVDRLARSLRDLLRIVDQISVKGATLVALAQQIDTATPAGRMFLQMLGVIAEFERELIRERQAAGIAAARARGDAPGGRKRVIDRSSVGRLLREGVSTAEIARRLRIGQASVYRIMDELNREKETPCQNTESANP
jgi:DNA invertase Pin-like site-specific DNA recombinase